MGSGRQRIGHLSDSLGDGESSGYFDWNGNNGRAVGQLWALALNGGSLLLPHSHGAPIKGASCNGIKQACSVGGGILSAGHGFAYIAHYSKEQSSEVTDLLVGLGSPNHPDDKTGQVKL